MTLLDRIVPGRQPAGPALPRTAIIDIGSNSIRLVVYQGPPRLPAILFNEKVLAGLGRGLAADGRIDAPAMRLATAALARFGALAKEMGAGLRTVATAAVRDAANGGELLDIARGLGLTVELLTGEEEATASGLGVLSAFPDADGIVGDLGGGSLELVRVSGGELGTRVSFPLGVLRVAAMRAKGEAAFDKAAARMIAEAGWAKRGKGLPLYLVGGSWRALAQLHMHLSAYPLPVVHGYAMSPEVIAQLGRTVAQSGKTKLRQVPGLSAGRIPTLADGAAILSLLMRELSASGTVASGFGLREGLLFQALDTRTRAEDPLLVAAREEGRREGRFPEHGDLLASWIAPLFPDEPPATARLRHVSCLLADVGWRANPEFRGERGMEVALHGNWVAIDAAGRAQVAQALHASLGGGPATPPTLARLASPAALAQATRWGLAIRLGQRLSGGLAGPLERSALSLDERAVMLRLPADAAALYGEAVEKRHAALAAMLGREARRL